jgi:hypothetical protein
MRLARRLLCVLYNNDFIFNKHESINKHENLTIKSIDRWILKQRNHGFHDIGFRSENKKLFLFFFFIVLLEHNFIFIFF